MTHTPAQTQAAAKALYTSATTADLDDRDPRDQKQWLDLAELVLVAADMAAGEATVCGHALPHTELFWARPIVTVERDPGWPADPAALIRTYDPAPLRMDPVAAARMSATILAAADPTGRYVVVDTRGEGSAP